MNIDQIIAPYSDSSGLNLFDAFNRLEEVDQLDLMWRLRKMRYPDFLRTVYWHAVSQQVRARAGMRCQICNSTNNLAAHHRSYDFKGKDHSNLGELICICAGCHAIFHGKTYKPDPKKAEPVPAILFDHEKEILVTKDVLDSLRTNGAFTSATVRGLFGGRVTLTQGWAQSLVGKVISRERYEAAKLGVGVFSGGKRDRKHPFIGTSDIRKITIPK